MESAHGFPKNDSSMAPQSPEQIKVPNCSLAFVESANIYRRSRRKKKKTQKQTKKRKKKKQKTKNKKQANETKRRRQSQNWTNDKRNPQIAPGAPDQIEVSNCLLAFVEKATQKQDVEGKTKAEPKTNTTYK